MCCERAKWGQKVAWAWVASWALSACQASPIGVGNPAPLGDRPSVAPPSAVAARAEAAGAKPLPQQPLAGLGAPLPRRLQQAGAGPTLWGFTYEGVSQHEGWFTHVEPGRNKIDINTGLVIGWFPARYIDYFARWEVVHYSAPGLPKVEDLKNDRFLITVPEDKVWVLTHVLKPETVKLNGIPLALTRPSFIGSSYAPDGRVETPTEYRILAGPGQQLLVNMGPGATMHGQLDDPAAYGGAFNTAPKYRH